MSIQSALKVPPLNKRTRIPMQAIRALAEYIAMQFDPDKIILFGSHAYGKPTGWSDVDFLVVMEAHKGELETAIEISNSLPEIKFSVDIIVRSQEAIEKRKKLGDWFLIDVTEKGKVLYERAD